MQFSWFAIAQAKPYDEYGPAFERIENQRNDYANTAKHFPHYTRALERHQAQRERLYGIKPTVSITIRRVPGSHQSHLAINRQPQSKRAQIERKIAELLRSQDVGSPKEFVMSLDEYRSVASLRKAVRDNFDGSPNDADNIARLIFAWRLAKQQEVDRLLR